VNALLGNELVPVSVRGKLLRRMGIKIAPGSCIWAGASLRSRRIEIGSDVFINVGFFYDGADSVVICNNVRIGQFVRLITATHNIGPPQQRCLVEAVTKPIKIEEGCWIGAGVTILPGVTIRRGCVIGAGSIVTTSTEANGLYAGNPAKRIKDLPHDECDFPTERLRSVR